MTEVAIHVDNLSKQYKLGQREPYKTFREAIRKTAAAPARIGAKLLRHQRTAGPPGGEYIWALKDVSFDVNHGEVLGIIGRNGAGKSTLLKLLTRITEPTAGRAEIYGRVGSLLEVGTGFHPELTGRENVFLNGAILGMKKTEIERKFDEIVAFAEIEKFLDTPVKRYSSGMYVRLAFSVAAHLEPEILVVDEVLAVGDVGFQQKCLGKMGEVSQEGRTVLFVSHNLSAVWSLCPKSIWLDGGRLKAYGPSADIINDYRETMRVQESSLLRNVRDRKGAGNIRVTKIAARHPTGEAFGAVRAGGPVTFVLDYESKPGTHLDDVEVNLIVANDRDNRLFVLSNRDTGMRFTNLPAEGRLICNVPNLPLIPGDYNVHISCLLRGGLEDKVMYASRLSVAEGDFFGTGRLPLPSFGDVLVMNEWHLET